MNMRNKSIYPKRIWTVEDKMFLRQNYNTMPMPEIMERLCRTDDAIHWMASHLGLTGHRYSINNFWAGKSYKKNCQNVARQQQAKKVIVKQSLPTVIKGRRKRKTKGHRWCDQKLASKPFTTEGKKTVKIDHKTIIYVSANASESEIESIKDKYKKVI